MTAVVIPILGMQILEPYERLDRTRQAYLDALVDWRRAGAGELAAVLEIETTTNASRQLVKLVGEGT